MKPSSLAVFTAIFESWHDYAQTRKVDKLLSLYADDATLESPLVPAIMGRERGVLQGKTDIREFLEKGTQRRPDEWVKWHRTDKFFCNDNTLIWEYPRVIPDGEQIDILEVMDIVDGKIAAHRIYWGWLGTGKLIKSYQRPFSVTDVSPSLHSD